MNRSRVAGAGVLSPSSARPWYCWDIVLVAIPLSYGMLLDSCGVFNYIDGLTNGSLFAYAFPAFVLLSPVALICLIVELVRMLIVWPVRIHGWRRLVLCWAAVSTAFAICILLPLTGVRVKPLEMYMRGFRRNMQARADIRAIQAWLAIVDPNDCEGQPLGVRVAEGVNIPNPPKYVAPPGSIRHLRPRYTKLMLDNGGRPMIRLTWGGGLMGHWGLVVGSENMEIPETRPEQKKEYGYGANKQVLYEPGEYRLPLAAGAYVWRGMD